MPTGITHHAAPHIVAVCADRIDADISRVPGRSSGGCRPIQGRSEMRRLKPALYEIGFVAAMKVARGSKPMAAYSVRAAVFFSPTSSVA